MWRSKKFIIIAVLAAVVLVGSVVGVASASTGIGTTLRSTTLSNAASANITPRVAQILGIDPTTLQNAINQARQEQRDAALDKYLSDQVTAGKLSQAQADQYKAWLKAKPDVPAFGPGKNFGMHRFGGRGGMMGGWCTPAPSPTK